MKLNQRTLLLIAGAAVSLLLPALLYMKVRFPQPLSSMESAVLNIQPASSGFSLRTWQTASPTMPVTAPKPVAVAPKTTTSSNRQLQMQPRKPQIKISVTDNND